ncbi:hypothetical protein CERZMDRAFT_81563 [Cercospora zeae-maydis SCOH1-5]|uniref:Zn(2)-C6 fungal-type domain-containing protein n=1 Tax=Cercospora zeae-maydis SCOH1-5 TaxID=717836 RepID=A0A6A6FSN9_9PEZI|nr:hypothetical protein CERZMDRAFT_81563 [Cercospora zeae-maydis SCOH1-5]
MSFCTTGSDDKAQGRTGCTFTASNLHTNACDQCYRRKQACSKEQPSCGRCRLDGRQCTYSESRGAGRPRKVTGNMSSPSSAARHKQQRVDKQNYDEVSTEVCDDNDNTFFGNSSSSDQFSSGDYSNFETIGLQYSNATPLETNHFSFSECNKNQKPLLEFDRVATAGGAMELSGEGTVHSDVSPQSEYSSSSSGARLTSLEVHQHSAYLGHSGEDLLRYIELASQDLIPHGSNHSEDSEPLDDVRPHLLAAIDLGERLIMSDGSQSSGGLFLMLLGVIQQIDGYLGSLGPQYSLSHNHGMRIIMLASTLDFPEKFGMHDKLESSTEGTKALANFTSQLQHRVRDRMRLMGTA